jgi:phenylalanyl-tRNA synthetase beta subunit
MGMNPEYHFRVVNPVSLDYEYIRISLIPSLMTAIKINPVEKLQLFEIDKIFLKTPKGANEKYKVAGIYIGGEFRDFKSAIELIFSRLNINDYLVEFDTDKPYLHKSNAGTIKAEKEIIGEFGEISPEVLSAMEISSKVYCFEMDIETLTKLSKTKIFSPIPANPPQIEDLTLIFPPKTRMGEVIDAISNSQKTHIKIPTLLEFGIRIQTRL